MGDQSGIEWTDASWNPIVGCSIVSPGCTNCYAMGQAARIIRMDRAARPAAYEDGGTPSHYADTVKLAKGGDGPAVWTGKVALAPEHILTAPLRWKRPRRIFVNSMGDLFHESVPDEWIDRVFAVMALTPQHTYQVLTKRSARMRAYMAGHKSSIPYLGRMPLERIHIEAAGHMEGDGGYMDALKEVKHANIYSLYLDAPWPLPNVWLGVSAEDQRRADERVPDLLATPAAIRFVSAEPLLGPIDFEKVGTLQGIRSALPGVVEREERGRPTTGDGSICGAQIDAIGSSGSSITFFQTPDHMGGFTALSPRGWPRLDWIIVGGESGPGARPMHPDWARSIRDQCADAGVPFFFKQWGEWAAIRADLIPIHRDRQGWLRDDGRLVQARSEADLDLIEREERKAGRPLYSHIARVGKRAAGRLLDGREHNEMPARTA